jgi:hypothetical protein
MNECPNCKCKSFALIIEGLDEGDELIIKLIKSKKIVKKESLESYDCEKWICNECLSRWGISKNKPNETDSFDFEQGFNLDEVYD